MARRNPLPKLWLVTDARTDAKLDRAIARLPRGSGVIFRHWHLPPGEREARLETVRRLCRRHGHLLELAGKGYGPPAPHRRLAAAHDLREIGRANRFGARTGGAAILLSPVYPTATHPGAKTLGRVKFLALAKRARVPVIALGGMTARRFHGLPAFPGSNVHGWAAIDGLAPPDSNPEDS